MAITRYNNRGVFRNSDSDYRDSDIFRDRGVNFINQFSVAELNYFGVAEILSLDVQTKVWATGEKYFKLSNEFYGTPEYWWVIAWYNQKPLETDFKAGEVVEIPTPIELVLEFLNIV